MKKLISAFLCLGLLLGSTSALAAEKTFRSDIFTYTVSGKNATIINVEDMRSTVSVPKKLDNFTVTALGEGAFGGSTIIEHVVIPDTVTSVGDFCFAYSNSLKTVTFPSTLETISDGAFYHCEGLWTITLPSSLKTIGKNAFGRCSNLTAVTLPSSVTFIGEKAFPTTEHLRFYSKENSYPYTYAIENGIGFEEYITVTLNGKTIAFDQPCITDTERFRTLVPIRAVLEDLGAVITWDNTFNTARIQVKDIKLTIRPGEQFMMVNDTAHFLSSPPVEFNGRIMVPIRDVMENLNGTVLWNEEEKSVTITVPR
ncbi:MAG: leucine-rich repeat protein [Clostridia bacterium]|nr:leucine-rich repeat protein [Clostridia bacterium]